MTDDPDLQARVEALEGRVAELEARLERAARVSRARRAKPSRPPGVRVRWAEAKSEDVLGKVGIGLFLIGVLFLLREAVERGWLTAAVRVGGAGAIGAALVVVGMRMRESRPVLGRLLTGGGIAALFGTLWTAAVLYPLLPPLVALAGMAGVAALALVLASRENDAALSVVGTLGALMTPLLLYREGGQMDLLMGYAAVVLVGAALVYWRQGWAALVGSASVGGWGVVLVAWVVGIWPEAVEAGRVDRWAFSLGALAVWATTGAVPVLRARMTDLSSDPVFAGWPALVRPTEAAVFVAPLALIGFLDAAWTWSDAVFAGVALGVGAVAVGASTGAFSGPLRLAAVALAAWAVTRILGPDDGRTAAAIVAIGCALVWSARRDRQRDVALVGHAIAMGAAAGLVLVLMVVPGVPFEELEPVTGHRLLDATLAAGLGALALGGIGFASGRETTARGFHLTAAHLVVVVWLRLALGGMENGTALVSAAWGVYGVVLVVVGLRLGDDLVRAIGLGTVLLTVAKVLLVDLAEVPALWRIVLFMGLGALLLLVSYLVPSLLKGRTREGPGGDGLAEPPLPPTPSVPEPTEAE
ncbi:MAG: DUF2339 domain-containing protein [Bacteroidota bacterium]